MSWQSFTELLGEGHAIMPASWAQELWEAISERRAIAGLSVSEYPAGMPVFDVIDYAYGCYSHFTQPDGYTPWESYTHFRDTVREIAGSGETQIQMPSRYLYNCARIACDLLTTVILSVDQRVSTAAIAGSCGIGSEIAKSINNESGSTLIPEANHGDLTLAAAQSTALTELAAATPTVGDSDFDAIEYGAVISLLNLDHEEIASYTILNSTIATGQHQLVYAIPEPLQDVALTVKCRASYIDMSDWQTSYHVSDATLAGYWSTVTDYWEADGIIDVTAQDVTASFGSVSLEELLTDELQLIELGVATFTESTATFQCAIDATAPSYGTADSIEIAAKGYQIEGGRLYIDVSSVLTIHGLLPETQAWLALQA